MDPGVGSAGTLGQYFFSRNPSNSQGEIALNGGRIGLDLPARKAGAVIGQYQLDITHAEIESRAKNEHPRLHCLCRSGMKTQPSGSAILMNSLAAQIVVPGLCLADMGNPEASFCVVQL